MEDNKAVLVTGGSSNIGAAIAKSLARKGWFVYISYLNNHAAAQAAVEHIDRDGGKAFAIRADISDEAQVKSMFREIACCDYRLCGLVNNAGLSSGRHSAFAMPLSVVSDVMNTNYLGAVSCISSALKLMQDGGGSIVNILSQVIATGGYRLSHYAASKAALELYAKGSANELMRHGVRINNVSPGIIDSEANKDLPQSKVDALPAGRMGDPEEVANVVSWLMSEEASYVSGTTISVTGAR